MIQGIVINLVISFVLKQIEKFGDRTDWVKLKHDAELRVRALIPGTWFDDEAAYAVKAAIHALQSLLDQTDRLKALLKLLAGQKYPDAVAMLKQLLIDLWTKAQEPQLVKLVGALK